MLCLSPKAASTACGTSCCLSPSGRSEPCVRAGLRTRACTQCSRIKEYLDDFRDSPWLERWFKLDVIRSTFVPCHDRILNKVYTLVPSIRYVEEVRLLAGERDGDWQKARFRLGVEGVGLWESTVPIFMPLGPVPRRPKGWDHVSFD